MNQKIRVGVIFGGRSAEHEVSLQSARNIINAIDKERYDPVPICIGKSGEWYLGDADLMLLQPDSRALGFDLANDEHNTVNLVTGERIGQLIRAKSNERVRQVDVYFPVLHGPLGEDGTIQGLLRLANVPFVGSDVLGSAIGMDKDVSKRLLRDAKIPVANFVTFRRTERDSITYDDLARELGQTFFVKPANMGSSVGVHRITNETEYSTALDDAFRYDHKVICEESIVGREVECSVLGNNEPMASLVGEIVVHDGFYDYDAKYLDEDGAELIIPADLPPDVAATVRDYAVETFKVLECQGMARVDFFVRAEEVLVNEINTIPGFTPISMYPKLWEASGLSYTDLITRLIELAVERYAEDQQLTTTRD